MRPDVESISVQSNFTGEKRPVMIDPEAVAHIMESINGFYSNIHRAILRELSTNAHDSHVMAGVKRPIEVTLPNRLNNELIIRDYGLGLTVDDLYDMYTYGKSTKRESNAVSGMMGFGSKSPWGYTHSFSVVAVKDGIKTIALLTKNSQGLGEIQIVDTKTTDESNGVKISIPVKPGDDYQFQREAEYLFTYWPQDSVLVNGRPPRKFEYAIKISDNIFLVEERGGNDIVVQGGVPYLVRGENRLFQRNKSYRYYSAVVFAEIGDVFFTPSREGLKYHHTKTVAKLEEWHDQIKAKLAETIEAEIAQCSTYNEAARKAQEYTHFDLTLHYKDAIIPSTLRGHRYIQGDGALMNTSTSFANELSGIVITGFEGKKLSKQQRVKIDMHTGAKSAWLVDDDAAMWMDHLTHYKWSDIVKVKVSPAAKRGFTWGVLTRAGVQERTELKDNVVYVHVDDKPRSDFLDYWPEDTIDIVVLRKRYAAEFKKKYPNAKSLKQYAQDKRTEIEVQAQSKEFYRYWDQIALRELDGRGILDPEIIQHIAKAKATELSRYYSPHVEVPTWVTKLTGRSYVSVPESSPFRKYPLVNSQYINDNMSDVILYMNTKYTTNKGN